MALKKGHEFVHIVGVDTVGGDVGSADGLGQGVAFGLRTRCKHDFGEYFGVLCAFVRYDGAYAANADDDDFRHFYSFFSYRVR